MIKLTPEQIAQFFHRSYTAVDGLWFMKVEEQYGFDIALDIDEEVWKVMPKIQARFLKSITELNTGIQALIECFTTKLKIENFVFTVEESIVDKSYIISIKQCPWFDLLVKSKRTHLAEKIGTRICNTEFGIWAQEFGSEIQCELDNKLCKGGGCCTIKIQEQP